MDLFEKAMLEIRQRNQKEEEKKCKHERTYERRGLEICIECRSCQRTLCESPYTDIAGYDFHVKKEGRNAKIRDTLHKMLCVVTRDFILENGEYFYTEPPKPGLLPREIFDHQKEIREKCVEANANCHVRSLCAALLWQKIKSSYPKVITLTEFSKKVGVSVMTIAKMSKKFT